MNKSLIVSAETSRDPVTKYARHIVTGKIAAGRAVRLACQRHLNDLGRQRTRHFPYYFNRFRADECFRFFKDLLTLDDGRPFELMPWLKFIFGSLEGWVDVDDNQRFQTSYTETAKGTGKTPAAAGYGLYAVTGKEEINAEVYSLGVIGDQAAYLFQFAKRMCERSPEELGAVLDVGERNIAWLERANFFRPLSSEGKSLDNKRPYLAIVDELHEHPSDVIPSKMRLGFKGRKNALLFEITNAGHDKTSVCWAHHEYSMKVLEGVVTGAAADRWFAYICQLDPCEKHRLDGLTQPQDGCPDCDHWTDPTKWIKVQPALGVTISPGQQQALVSEALDRPTEQARIKRLNFCQWTQAHTVWIPADTWDACTRPRAELHFTNDVSACAAGFDMSEKLDLTAGVIALRVDDDDDAPVDTVTLTDVDNGQEVRKTLNINFCVELHAFFWLPEDTLLKRVRDEHIPFDHWRDTCRHCGLKREDHVSQIHDGHAFEGWLLVTPGPVIDHDLIYEQWTGRSYDKTRTIERAIAPRWRPQRHGYDPHNATQFAVALRDRAKYEIAEVKQGRPLSETNKLFEALVRLRRVRHDGNPVLAWCVSNADPKKDRYENLWLEKPSATKRIDGLIASVIALNQLVLLPAKRRKRGVAKVFTPSGFRDLGSETTHGGPPVVPGGVPEPPGP